MNINHHLKSAKARFIEVCNAYNEGKHGIWTAQEYITHWEKEGQLSDAELIQRLDFEAALIKEAAH